MVRMSKRSLFGRALVAVVVLFALIQFVPYGRSHANRATRPVKWDTPKTAQLFRGACQDCHSNLTDWRWYDKVAPGSWLLQHRIAGGRATLNASSWNQHQADVSEVVEKIKSGEMPPLQYKLIHPAGRLSSSQRNALARGMEATYKKDPPAGG